MFIVSVKKLNLTFESDHPTKFVSSQWQQNDRSLIYVIYRWIFCIFYAFSLGHSIGSSIADDHIIYSLIFLTRWNLTFTFIVSLISAFLATFHYLEKIQLEKMSKKLKFYWFLHNNVAPFACFITIFYWIFLYNGQGITINNVLVHGTNFIGPLIDLFIISHPYHISHCIYPMSCSIFYMIYTVIFQVAGGVNPDGKKFIYTATDWLGNPKKTAIMALVSVFMIGLLHIILCGVQHLRVKIHKKIRGKCDGEQIEINLKEVEKNSSEFKIGVDNKVFQEYP